MRLCTIAIAVMSVSLSLPGCDENEDLAPKAKAAQAQPAEAVDTASREAPPVAERSRRRGGPNFAAPAPEVSEAELERWWRVMQPLLEGDQETFRKERAAVPNWTELEIKVTGALIQYSAMLQAGVDPHLSGVVRTRYDRFLALSKKYQPQK